MKRLKFNGLETLVQDEELKEDVFDINFGYQMMVRFSHEEGKIVPINAMNGGGFNCYSDVKDEELVIEDAPNKM